MSEAELRAMVRDVLREALAKGGQLKGSAATPRTEAVEIASDADLAAFAQRLVRILDDPVTGQALRAGTLRFTLSGGAAAAAPAPKTAPKTALSAAPKSAPAGVGAVLDGTVTEARITGLAGSGTLVLARDAVITPLARDRARALGLKIERRR